MRGRGDVAKTLKRLGLRTWQELAKERLREEKEKARGRESPTPCNPGLFAGKRPTAEAILRLDMPGVGDRYRTLHLPEYKPGGKELCAALKHKPAYLHDRPGHVPLFAYDIGMCLCSLEAAQKQIESLLQKILPHRRKNTPPDWDRFRKAFRDRYGATDEQLDKLTPAALLALCEQKTTERIAAQKAARAKLLAAYKQERHFSDRQVYQAKNKPANKPEWHRWKAGILPPDSKTTLRIERFLAERTAPLPVPPKDGRPQN